MEEKEKNAQKRQIQECRQEIENVKAAVNSEEDSGYRGDAADTDHADERDHVESTCSRATSADASLDADIGDLLPLTTTVPLLLLLLLPLMKPCHCCWKPSYSCCQSHNCCCCSCVCMLVLVLLLLLSLVV